MSTLPRDMGSLVEVRFLFKAFEHKVGNIRSRDLFMGYSSFIKNGNLGWTTCWYIQKSRGSYDCIVKSTLYDVCFLNILVCKRVIKHGSNETRNELSVSGPDCVRATNNNSVNSLFLHRFCNRFSAN